MVNVYFLIHWQNNCVFSHCLPSGSEANFTSPGNFGAIIQFRIQALTTSRFMELSSQSTAPCTIAVGDNRRMPDSMDCIAAVKFSVCWPHLWILSSQINLMFAWPEKTRGPGFMHGITGTIFLQIVHHRTVFIGVHSLLLPTYFDPHPPVFSNMVNFFLSVPSPVLWKTGRIAQMT